MPSYGMGGSFAKGWLGTRCAECICSIQSRAKEPVRWNSLKESMRALQAMGGGLNEVMQGSWKG